jgi:hypothetical protein
MQVMACDGPIPVGGDEYASAIMANVKRDHSERWGLVAAELA